MSLDDELNRIDAMSRMDQRRTRIMQLVRNAFNEGFDCGESHGQIDWKYPGSVESWEFWINSPFDDESEVEIDEGH